MGKRLIYLLFMLCLLWTLTGTVLAAGLPETGRITPWKVYSTDAGQTAADALVDHRWETCPAGDGLVLHFYFDFPAGVEVNEIKLYTPSRNGNQYELQSQGENGIWETVPGFTSESDIQWNDGWNRVAIPEKNYAHLRLVVTKKQFASPILQEIEFWGTYKRFDLQRTYSAIKADPIRLNSGSWYDLSILGDMPAEAIEKAELVYDIIHCGSESDGYWNLNGQGQHSLISGKAPDAWTTVVEEINPALLKQGENRIAWKSNHPEKDIQVKNVHFNVYYNTGRVQIQRIEGFGDQNNLLPNLIDNNIHTFWESRREFGDRAEFDVYLPRETDIEQIAWYQDQASTDEIRVAYLTKAGWKRFGEKTSQEGNHAGWNVLHAEELSQTDRLRFTIVSPAGKERVSPISEIMLWGSAEEEKAKLVIARPEQGGVVGNPFRIRAFVRGDADQIAINGERFPLINGYIETEIRLASGASLHRIHLQAWKSGQLVDEKDLQVCTEDYPELIIHSPEDGGLTNALMVQVSGETDSAQNRITVNDKPVVWNGTSFAIELPLQEGLNPIRVTATGPTGIEKEQTVYVRQDGEKPEIVFAVNPLKITVAENIGTYLLQGSVSDDSRCRLYINGTEVSLNDGTFAYPVKVVAGYNHFDLRAVDELGQSADAEAMILADSTPPAAFTPLVRKQEGQLMLYFETSDAESGIHHYEVRIDDGSYRPAVSPFPLPVLAEDLHQAYVKAIDEAGNATVATAALGTDTVPVKPKNAVSTSDFVTPDGNADFAATQTDTGYTLNGPGLEIDIPTQSAGGYHVHAQSIGADGMDPAVHPIVSNTFLIYPVDEMGLPVEEDFAGDLTVTLTYNDEWIPDGYDVGDLKVFYFNGADANWEMLPVQLADPVGQTISFKSSKSAMYNIQASITDSFTEDTYQELGMSPYKLYFQQNEEYVSPSSGSLTIRATDLELAGRNNFNLKITRMYSSQKAVRMVVGDDPDGDGEYAAPEIIPSLGIGWEWAIPHIKKDSYGQYIYLDDGQAISCDWKNMRKISSTVREYSFVYHDGVHFSATKRQTKVGGKWNDTSVELIFKDGTRYSFAGSGSLQVMTDRTGENTIQFFYNKFGVTSIIDSLQRVITFDYDLTQSKFKGIRVNNELWVSYGYQGNQLSTVTDQANRVTKYDYKNYVYRTGGVIYIESEEYNFVDEDLYIVREPYYEQNNVREYTIPLLTAVTYPMKGQSKYDYNVGGTISKDINIDERISSKNGTCFHKKTGHSIQHSYKVHVLKSSQYTEASSTVAVNVAWYDYKTITSEVTDTIDGREVKYEKTFINRAVIDQVDHRTIMQFDHKGLNTEKRMYDRKGKAAWTDADEPNWDVKEVRQYDDHTNLTMNTVYHSAGAAPSYTDTYTYDEWGNVTSQRNSVSNVTYYYTFYNTDSEDPENAQFIPYTEEPVTTLPQDSIHNLIQYEFVVNTDSVRNVQIPVETHYRYDLKGNPVTKARRHDGKWVVTRMVFDQWGNVTRITEPVEGTATVVTDFTYDSTWHTYLVKEERDAGKDADGAAQGKSIVQYGYTGFGWKSWEIDPMGGLTEFKYDQVGRLTVTRFPDDTDQYSGTIGALTPSSYTAASRKDNPVQIFVYDDAQNTVTAAELTLGTSTEESAAAVIKGITSTIPNPVAGGLCINSMTANVYDGLNHWIELKKYLKASELQTVQNETQTSPFVTKFAYDEYGNRIKETDAEGYVTFKVYDGFGRLTYVYYPDDVRNKAAYDSRNAFTRLTYVNQAAWQKVTVTDPVGNVKDELKDWSGRIIEVGLVDKTDGNKRYATSFLYDSLGNQIQVKQGTVNGSGNPRISQNIYDDWNQLKQQISPEMEVLPPGTTSTRWSKPVVTYEYDLLGRKTAETDANGNALSVIDGYRTEYVYDNGTNIVKTVQKSRSGDLVTRYYYDRLGHLIKTINPELETSQTVYNRQGLVVAEVNALGQITYYQYNAFGLRTAVTDPRGVAITESSGGVLKLNGKSYNVTLNAKYTTTFAYDSLARQITMTDALGTRTVTKYDRLGAVVEERVIPGSGYGETDAAVTTHTYTPRGWVESVTYGGSTLQSTTQYQYYADGTQRKEIHPTVQGMAAGSNCYEYFYDGLGQLKKMVRPDQSYEEYQYDAFGNRTSFKNGRGYTTSYKYNSYNQLTEVVEPTGSRTTYCYEPNGNLVRTNQSNGLSTEYDYNDLNQLTKEFKTRAGDVMAYQYAYDKAGRQIASADPKGNIAAFAYDDAGQVKVEVHYAPLSENGTLPDLQRVTTTQVPSGYSKESQVSFVYDPAGNLTDVTDRLGGQHFDIDELGRVKLDKRSMDGKDYITNYKYTSGNRVKEIAYPNGKGSITYEYNQLDQLQSVSQFADDWKANPTKNFVYDPAGNLVQMRYNNGVTTVVAPNQMSRPASIAVKVPQGGTTVNELQLSYQYDYNGNITKRNNNTYGYDELDRLKSATVEGNVLIELAPVIGYVSGDYTAAGTVNYLLADQEVKLDYAAATLGMKFERESQIQRIDLSTSKQAGHRVTKDGLRIFKKSAADTGFVEVAPDQWDFWKDEQTGCITVTFHTLVRAAEMKIHSNYDDRDIVSGVIVDRSTFANQLKKIVRVYEGTTKVKMDYTYDSVGNRTTEVFTNVNTSNKVTYAYAYYTGSDRLKTRASNSVSGFAGDVRSELGGSPSYGPSRGMAYQYDKAGNLTVKGSSYTDQGTRVSYTQTAGENVAYWKYLYDAQNQLVTVFRNGETSPVKAVARYGYSYAGKRQKVVEGNTVTHYIYDLSGQMIQEAVYTTTGSEPFTASGSALVLGDVTSYVYADGRQIAKVEGALSSGARYYMHQDNLGSTMLVTQAAGNGAAVVYRQDYLPFGQSMNAIGSADGAEPDFKFTGQYADRDTGLYYYGARYYDPETGRFTQEDTYFGSLEMPGTQNLYVYALNNPLKYIDPTGHYNEVAHESDWQLLFESDPNEAMSWAFYINSQGQLLYTSKTRSLLETTITNTYYDSTGHFDHIDTKSYLWNGKEMLSFPETSTPSSTQPSANGGVGDYLSRSADQVIRGNYSQNVTLLGTAGQVTLGVFGVDLPADIRDIMYDFTHWEWSGEHVVQVSVDVLGAMPGIGALKPIFICLGGLKFVDEAGALVKHGDEALGAVKGAGKTLAKSGYIDAQDIRFTQSSIKSSFKNGDSVYDTISGLKSGKIKPGDMPEIRIFEKDGQLYTLDNRRLFAAQEAGVNVKYRMATSEEVANESWKFTTKNNGTSIKVR